jgi:Ca2+-binding RTX toxin-like protein
MLNNALKGNSGDNILVGYAGLDTLTGGSGNDVFRLRDLSKDTITDFSVTDDRIELDNDVFTKFTTTGKVGAWNFQINSTALESNDYLIYDKTTGELFYDADGNGPAAQTPIALLSTKPALTNADFWIIE